MREFVDAAASGRTCNRASCTRSRRSRSPPCVLSEANGGNGRLYMISTEACGGSYLRQLHSMFAAPPRTRSDAATAEGCAGLDAPRETFRSQSVERCGRGEECRRVIGVCRRAGTGRLPAECGLGSHLGASQPCSVSAKLALSRGGREQAQAWRQHHQAE